MSAHLSQIDLANPQNIFDFVVKKGYGVKGLSDMGIPQLPQQYIQPPEKRITGSTIITDDSIPIIDVSNNWDDPMVADQICKAAQKWGFFQVINHGVPIEALDKIKEACYRFFSLPVQEKVKYSGNWVSSNVRYGTSFSPEAEKTLEWKDYLSFLYVSDKEATLFWPPSCREEAQEYLKRCDAIIRSILKVLMGGLNIKAIDEEKEELLMGSKRLNFNYYPKCPNPELSMGVGPHSDITTISVLLQDDIGGLYVKEHETDALIHVPPINGALVINIGDALQIMSNDKYKSIEHRVIANESKNRVSVPIFLFPKLSSVIGPLKEVMENGEKPIYKQVLFEDYSEYFFNKSHDGKATLEFARI